jgi:hypothetical protein
MDRFILTMLSFYLGLGSFFSFFVAPTLFRLLESSQAGKVVERVFPVYFGTGIAVFALALLLGFMSRFGKFYSLLTLTALILLLLLEFYILPVSHSLKTTDYQAFLKYHGMSMVMNLAVLIICLLLVVYIIRR